MNSFEYCCPTEIVFGKDAELKAGEKISACGAKTVLVVYGGGSVKRNGLLDRLCKNLGDSGLKCIILGGVKPNPVVSFVREGIKTALREKVDFIMAVGGGSVIDTAKALAHGLANYELDIWDDIWQKKVEIHKTTPIASVLTLAAAGSETSDSAVLTNEETGQKRGLSTVLNRPKMAFMNPELTYSAPKFQVACGISDILMHTLERYFSKSRDNYMTDFIAEGLMKNVIQFSRDALEKENDYLARSEIMYCGSLSHCDLTGLGRQKDFSVHKLGHELSGKFDVAHGASLTTMWASWARYSYQTDIDRFARLAGALWQVEKNDASSAALEGIARMENYFKTIGMPTCFSELGIGVQNEKDINYLADMCTDKGKKMVGNFKPIDRQDAINMYKMANH
ncbi:iron-containing alcohol dehydrogenase [Pectinatus haikarae]|uniref:Alcohol dehydrogenase YqhD (Iron-dependent ADH family) n=1 Tax=Pectinatus haikarae TaxID=349096 RepID=A0ABT9Y7G3_9FIRM|nr:iron-containing alcohol dehydrogenase [Pectinatus haikarae]MDQ0203651.1 alcohol dehydrogenase YqhD (iron-dependent ADH family) [Pectinatus haikarae]